MLNIGKILTFVSKKHQKWSKSHEFLMFLNKYALNNLSVFAHEWKVDGSLWGKTRASEMSFPINK